MQKPSCEQDGFSISDCLLPAITPPFGFFNHFLFFFHTIHSFCELSQRNNPSGWISIHKPRIIVLINWFFVVFTPRIPPSAHVCCLFLGLYTILNQEHQQV